MHYLYSFVFNAYHLVPQVKQEAQINESVTKYVFIQYVRKVWHKFTFYEINKPRSRGVGQQGAD